MSSSGRRPVILSGAFPSFASTRAPIIVSGSMIRFIGLFCSDSSPVKTDSKFCPASIPESSRIVVPLLPQSRSPAGFRRPRFPAPVTVTAEFSRPIFDAE